MLKLLCCGMLWISLISTLIAADDPAEEAEVVKKLTNLNAKCFTNKQRVVNVAIKESWTGGDDGLQLVKRLTRLESMILIGSPAISERALAQFRKDAPHVVVRQWSRAVLGIGIGRDEKGSRVRSVATGYPADRAGLKVGDVIVNFAGKEVRDLESIPTIMLPLKPKEKVAVVFLREGQEHTVEVVLAAHPD